MRRALVASAITAAAGWLGVGICFLVDPRRTLFAYLASFGFWFSTAVGALVLVMTGHAIRARWFVALRRLSEVPMATLPVFLLLVLPLLLGASTLYPWAGSLDMFSPEERHLLAEKGAWFSLPFFAGRCLVYLLGFATLAAILTRGSVAQDHAARPEDSVAIGRRLQILSAGGLPAVALLLTFASFDLFMSLEPTWLSTMYGVYVFAGGFLAAQALAAILATAFRHQLLPEVSASHFHALGKLLFSFVIFWAYIAFVQFLIIWIADLPREVRFYLHRTEGSWAAVTWLLVLAHFVVPFALLLSRELKRRPALLAWVAILLILAHRLDFEWLVLPVHDRSGYSPHLADLAAFLAQGGVLVLAGLLAFRGRPAVAVGDPELARSLEYRTR